MIQYSNYSRRANRLGEDSTTTNAGGGDLSRAPHVVWDVGHVGERHGATCMDVTRLLLWSDLRRRWRSWLALVVLAGVVGGLSMAAVAGWRRTSTAMDRFVDFHRPANSYVEGVVSRDEVEAIDGVEEAIGGDYFLLVPIDDQGKAHPEHLGQVSPFSFASDGAFVTTGRPIVVAGEIADPQVESEVMVDEEMAELYGLGPGDTLTMQGYGQDQIEQLFGALGSLEPTGRVFEFEVTGIVRGPEDVVPNQDVPDVVYLGSAAVLLGTAFDEAHRRIDVPSIGALFGDLGPAGTDGYEVRIDFDETTRSEFEDAVRQLDPEANLDFSGSDALRARRRGAALHPPAGEPPAGSRGVDRGRRPGAARAGHASPARGRPGLPAIAGRPRRHRT